MALPAFDTLTLAGATFAGVHDMLASSVRDMQAVVRGLSPASLSGDEAAVLVDLLAQGEKAATSGIALLTPRVVQTGAHAKAGHGSAAAWLGSVSGSSPSVAKARLASAKRASADAGLTEALHEGELSTAELKLMGDAEAAAPGSAQTLLDLAQAGASHQKLRDTATRLQAGARSKQSDAARRARVHERRHFRWRQSPEGGVRGEFLCDDVAWARVAPQLEADAKARWKAAGSTELTSLEAHRLDVFLEYMAGAGSGSAAGSGAAAGSDGAPGSARGAGGGSSGGSGGGPGAGPGPRSDRRSRVETLVLIDAEALRRGTTEGEETCEIEGIGPVSVAAATELLGEGALRYLIKEGFDIKTVTRSSRSIAKAVEAALIVRDRTCCVPGCGKRLGLERDHVFIDYGDDGPTELDNLVRMCPEHHALKTFGGWRLLGEPGHFTWVAPAHRKSANAISRARKVATAKADRNRLRRT